MVVFHSYVSLPEGIPLELYIIAIILYTFMHMLLVLLHTIATILFNNSIYILYIHARSIIILLLLLIYNFCYYYYRLYHTHAIDRSRIDGIQMVYSIRYIYRSKKMPKTGKDNSQNNSGPFLLLLLQI